MRRRILIDTVKKAQFKAIATPEATEQGSIFFNRYSCKASTMSKRVNRNESRQEVSFSA